MQYSKQRKLKDLLLLASTLVLAIDIVKRRLSQIPRAEVDWKDQRKQKSTAPGIPRQSPIQVLTRLNVA